jgi:hypothetical protein
MREVEAQLGAMATPVKYGPDSKSPFSMHDLHANAFRVRREGKPPRILRERGFWLRHALFEYFPGAAVRR